MCLRAHLFMLCFLILCIFSVSFLLSEQALLPLFYLLAAAAFCRWKWKTINILYRHSSSTYTVDMIHIICVSNILTTAIYSRLYIENEFVIWKSGIVATSSYVTQMCFCKSFLSTSKQMHCNIKKKKPFGGRNCQISYKLRVTWSCSTVWSCVLQ